MQESLTPFSLRRGPPFRAGTAERLFLCLPGGDALLDQLDGFVQRLALADPTGGNTVPESAGDGKGKNDGRSKFLVLEQQWRGD